ncbi:MAG: serine hydroxymethyltransferase, partial [Candidatus Firestonebacteria bacterium]|nr:serine hydroxymethyltransferase [Candidatus Firestonebacteria bacterium]
MKPLSSVDPEVVRILALETERETARLQMIASENYVSPAVLEAQGSVFTNKYAEGYPG